MKSSGRIKYWFAYHIRRPVIEKLYSLCNTLQDTFTRGSKYLESYAYGPAIHYERPTKAEREERNKHLRIGVVTIFIVAGLLVLISWFAKYYFTVMGNNLSFDDWNSSAGSFWGAVLGAAIAGVVTVCTTILVIQRSYKIDYHRERLDALPVLDMKVFFRTLHDDTERGKGPSAKSAWAGTRFDDLLWGCQYRRGYSCIYY